MDIYHPNFIENKYFRIYVSLIEKRKLEILIKSKEQYVESHHIIPDSMGGDNDKSNKVNFTAREHFVAHKLLAKCTKGNSYYKMLEAITYFASNKNRKLNFTSRDYEFLKIANSIASSKRNTGIKRSEETKQKMKYPKSEEHKAKLRESNIGKPRSEEAKQKMKDSVTPEIRLIRSEANKNKIVSAETREKLRIASLGKPMSEEVKQKIRIANTGSVHTDEAREKIKKAKTGVKHKILKCPHCGKEGGRSNMTRYHFDNCKFKDIQ